MSDFEDDDIESPIVDSPEDSNLPQEVKKRRRKGTKKIPARKLPRILKKNYKASRIERKLYKKIYVTSDKTLLQSLFEENPEKPGYLYIPRDKMIDKIDFKRLKSVGKDLRRRRGSFRLVPFAAVVVLIVSAYTAVMLFKNPLAKKGLTMALQAAFGARTDIDWVNVEFLNATITIGNLQQANKDSPMKNLFQIDKTEISFNLTEALRGKFDARNIEVSGLALNTDRTYSGVLPNPPKSEPNPMVEAVMAEINQRKDAGIAAAKKSIEDAFAEYNPMNMIEKVKENLSSPEVAKETKLKVEEAVDRWKGKPDEIKKQVDQFSADTNKLVDEVNVVIKKDFSKMKTALEVQESVSQIKNMIENTNELLDRSKSLTNTAKGLVNDIKDDATNIKEISKQISEAIKNDTALVKEQLDKITSFNLDTGTKILSNALESAIYAIVGNYYPYVVQVKDYAMQLKAKSDSGSKDGQKKLALLQPRHKRLSGYDVYWRGDNVPRFLIENIKFSGLGVAVNGTQISSDMDKRGAPATVVGSYQQGETRTHNAQVVVDARTKTSNPLVGVQYSGDNYPFAFSTPYLKLDSNTMLTATGSVDKTGAVSIGAQLDMGSLLLDADEFEPAFVNRVYKTALGAIDNLVVGAMVEINGAHKLGLKITSDLDQKFNTVLKTVVNSELKILIADAQTQITKILNENCGDFMDKISEFVNIEDGLTLESLNAEKLKSVLNEKKGELEAKLKEQAKAKVEEASDKAKAAAKDAIGDALKNSGLPAPQTPATNNENSNNEAAEQGSDEKKKAFGNALKGLLNK